MINTGAVALIISDAKGSCQCTIPEWPKEPIKPGQSAIINVHYNTSHIGPISKTVTLKANIEGEAKVIRIKGNVIAPDGGGALDNTKGRPVNE